MSKTNNSAVILKTLKGRKKGLTAAEIAAKTGLKLSSTRTTLWDLRSGGSIELVGSTLPTGVGRPSNLYTAL